MRIGELAARTGLTSPTIRYYEQIGLLAGGPRPRRSHRMYTEEDVDRLDLLRRLRDLLGLSLNQLKDIAAAEEAAAALPAALADATSPAERQQLIDETLQLSNAVLHLVRAREIDLKELGDELAERTQSIRRIRITFD